ncbi:Hachiman antiphage defense system protein HamA [Hymenobacter sp. CRA2]|uniref:Hachiman antiphage defense system protein HamA n=1 Tax=Hymenobacter sp. CRA2 TaxID=1955620 RepID=UPI001591CC5A|nr:Hachiman antiphage defense system protein HamA [Hymenobacter sp. CRA2]
MKVEAEPDFTLCYVEDFCIEFKREIRNCLAKLFSGAANVNDNSTLFTYKWTVKEFLERYNGKDLKTKKGMIGELLAHILINKHHLLLKTVSILANKEERSIRKGFDIIYLHDTDNSIWYSEVKSGNSRLKDSTTYNRVLLNRAKTGLTNTLLENSDYRWFSAIVDARLTLDGPDKIKASALLSNDFPSKDLSVGTKRNVIIITVLYHCLTDRILSDNIKKFQKKLIKSGTFQKSIIFCIQKTTYKKVERFLIKESI